MSILIGVDLWNLFAFIFTQENFMNPGKCSNVNVVLVILLLNS